MKRQYLAAAVFAGGFLLFGMKAFTSSLSPYVTFAEARRAEGSVQVAGAAAKAEARYDSSTGTLTFPLIEKDTGERLLVAYKGAKPASFDEAEQVVAQGRYNGRVLEATRLLVKCPSKYNMTTSGGERPDHAAFLKQMPSARNP